MKLENLPKKQVFDVPDGYFDALPQKIQARISAQNPRIETSFVFRYRLQYVIPVVLLLIVGITWYAATPDENNIDSMLASVETEDMITFLGESDMTTEDLLDNGSFSADDADAIETEVYDLHLEDEGLDELLENIDTENI